MFLLGGVGCGGEGGVVGLRAGVVTVVLGARLGEGGAEVVDERTDGY